MAQRTNSSTAVSIRPSRSSSRSARWSGKSHRARIACEVVWRVVSLPATESSTRKAPISASVSRSPSTSAWTRSVIRSSAGCLRRSAQRRNAISFMIAIDLATTSSGVRPCEELGVVPGDRGIDAPKTASWSSSGTPSIRMIVIIGSRLATASTKSPSNSSPRSSTIVRASARMPSSIRLTARGLNPSATSLRSVAWRGSSIARKDCDASSISTGMSSNITPWPEQNRSGSRDTSRTSS